MSTYSIEEFVWGLLPLSMMLLGGGKKGNEPLMFRRGGLSYRGFLEGRVDGESYALILHLSNMELKRPSEKEEEDEG